MLAIYLLEYVRYNTKMTTFSPNAQPDPQCVGVHGLGGPLERKRQYYLHHKHCAVNNLVGEAIEGGRPNKSETIENCTE